MDEGWHLMTRILTADPADRATDDHTADADVVTTNCIGRRVEVSFSPDPRDESRLLPTFTLRREQ
jgi:hypothetical protein